MKAGEHHNPESDQGAERRLCEAFLALESVDEVQAFLRDLCTPAELQAMSDRWRVVGMLRQDRPYREINQCTGVSVTTVGRVARYLEYGNGGYSLVADRLSLGAESGIEFEDSADTSRPDDEKDDDKDDQKESKS